MYTPPPDLRAKASATAQGGSTHEHHRRRRQPAHRKHQQAQKQTAKEVIAANVQALIEQLEQGHSEALTAYLTAMGRFHNYSFGNILEIARQKPDATRVAGLYAWNQLGRKVKKGERGIGLLHPALPRQCGPAYRELGSDPEDFSPHLGIENPAAEASRRTGAGILAQAS